MEVFILDFIHNYREFIECMSYRGWRLAAAAGGTFFHSKCSCFAAELAHELQNLCGMTFYGLAGVEPACLLLHCCISRSKSVMKLAGSREKFKTRVVCGIGIEVIQVIEMNHNEISPE